MGGGVTPPGSAAGMDETNHRHNYRVKIPGRYKLLIGKIAHNIGSLYTYILYKSIRDIFWGG